MKGTWRFCLVAIVMAMFAGAVWPAERHYTVQKRSITFSVDQVSYSVDLDFGVNEIEQPVQAIGDYSFPSFDWHAFFNRALGREMDETQGSLFDEAVKSLRKVMGQEPIPAERQFRFTLAFTNALQGLARPSPYDGLFVQPYELLLLGPTTLEEFGLVFGGLLSAQCFEIKYVALDQRWYLLLLSGNLPYGQRYQIGEKTYVLYPAGKARQDNGLPESRVAWVVPVSSRCSFNDVYQPPLRLSQLLHGRLRTPAVSTSGRCGGAVSCGLPTPAAQETGLIMTLVGGRYRPLPVRRLP